MSGFDLKRLIFPGLLSIMLWAAFFQPAAVASRNGFRKALDEDYMAPHAKTPSPEYGPVSPHSDLEGSVGGDYEDYIPTETHSLSPDSGWKDLTNDHEDYTPPETDPPAPDSAWEDLTDDHEDYTPAGTDPPIPDSGLRSIPGFW